MSPERRVVLEDLTRVRWPLDPALSPDGQRLAFVASGPDLIRDQVVYELMIHDLEADVSHSVAMEGARQPAWSPDGNEVAFIAEVGGHTQVCTRSGGPLEDIGGDVVDYAWSPDSSHMAVLTASSDLTLISIENRSATSIRDLVTLRGNPVGVSWSPTDEVIALVTGDSVGSDHRLSLVDCDSGELDQVLSWRGPMHELAWSPDGSSIAVAGRPQNPGLWSSNELWLVPVSGSQHPRRICPQLDRSIGQAVRGDDERGVACVRLAWHPSGDSVLTVFADGGRSHLARFFLDDHWEPVTTGDRAVVDFDVASTGRIALSWSDPVNPGILSLTDMGEERRIIDLNEGWLDQVDLFPTEWLTTTSENGTSIDGWITEPEANGDASPLVVQVHGGPHYPVGFRFSFDTQRLAAQGMAVLRFNPQGSQGYGSAFASSLVGDWGGPDLENLLTITRVAAARPAIDESRIAVIGESYGGYLAGWAIANGGPFVAGVLENGISDLVAMGRGVNGTSFWHRELGGSPDERPDLYEDRSPVTHVESMNAPLLLIHAEQDTNVPIAQSEKLHDRLVGLGREVEMHRVPEEGHLSNVLGRPSHRLTRTEVLDRFLLGQLVHSGPQPNRWEPSR